MKLILDVYMELMVSVGEENRTESLIINSQLMFLIQRTPEENFL